MKRRGSPLVKDSSSIRPKTRCSELISDYIPLTSGLYDFSICFDQQHGKFVQSDTDIPDGKEILLESPLICWPFGCSALNWESVIFCEHCLRLFPLETPIVIASVNQNGHSVINSTTTAIRKQIVTGSNTAVPGFGTFCPNRCSFQAVDGGVAGAGVGWFSIIGGSEGLKKLREADWHTTRRGKEQVIRSQSPISIESLARYLCSLSWRYCMLKNQLETQHQGLVFNEDVENQIFAEAGRTFERLVTPALPSDYDSNKTSSILQSIIGDRLALFIPPRLVHILLQTESVAQIWGQLVVNAQRLNIWGSDLTGQLCVLQGGGVFTLQSCFNHSCAPNGMVSCAMDSTLTVKAIQWIATGEEITIPYIETDQPVENRRQLLAEGYLFWCQCRRCQDESDEGNQLDI